MNKKPNSSQLRSIAERSAGWASDLDAFETTHSEEIQYALESFVTDFSPEQSAAWSEEILLLKKEANELIHLRLEAKDYGTLLEYKLPYDERRPDVILLADGSIVVIELKGKSSPNQADLDQVSAYVRDLRSYHSSCHNRDVYPILVPTRSKDSTHYVHDVLVVPPNQLDKVVDSFATNSESDGPSLEEFLGADSYCPLPTLIEAARELFESRTVRKIWRARAATEPAVESISKITHDAAQTRTRRLILVSGVPGSGKTLVGMRAVHAKFLDDLLVDRKNKRQMNPGLYLTGNGPLAEVLQYELRQAGGGGQTFVRHIKSYLDRYIPNQTIEPPEHLLVFDEAQRAFSPEKVADTHRDWKLEWIASEPELFVRICDRMPDWSVMVGLIGGGQEIHLGEEEGLGQWAKAIKNSQNNWTVHAPSEIATIFDDPAIPVLIDEALNLDTEIRFHRATHLHEFVENLLIKGDSTASSEVAENILSPYGQRSDGLRLYLTRDLGQAKEYLKDRYLESPQARYGIIASSRDKDLTAFGINNDFMSTKQVRLGPWFSEGEDNDKSCRKLRQVVTEFGCQGLELEMAIVAWGTDLIRENGEWTHRMARNYSRRGRTQPKDPFQMRLNAYRVLLTRGRDGTIVYLPPLEQLDETWDYLLESGFQSLD